MTSGSSSSPRIFRRREHHRDVQGGAIRAAIFGISDGLVTNASLILGVAGAEAAGGTVRLAGLAGLVAGAISMAAGEYVSMSAQTELLERELDVERKSIAVDPDYDREELAAIYRIVASIRPMRRSSPRSSCVTRMSLSKCMPAKNWAWTLTLLVLPIQPLRPHS